MTDQDPAARAADPEAAPPPLDRDDEYSIAPDIVAGVREAIEAGDASILRKAVEELHEADVADLIEQLGDGDRERLIGLVGEHLEPEVLINLEESVRDQVLGLLDNEIIARAAAELETDEVVYLIGDMDTADRAEVLTALDEDDRAVVEESLAFPEYTAGRIMQRELVRAPIFWTVGEIIDFMRASETLPEQFYDVFLVDPAMKPVGTVALSKIMARPRATLLSDIAEEDFRTIPVDQSQEDVAYAFSQYRLVSAPVVNADGRLVGVITIDDALEALEEETEEDIMRLAGVGEGSLSDKVWRTTRARLPWLGVNLVTAIIASLVIAQFDAVIEQIVALAVLMPIVASMGGNAGTQTLTVAVRALATRDLTASNAWRIILRETLVGLGNGLIFAVAIAAIGLVWYGDPMLGVVLAMAMVINLVAAGLAGILIPIGLDRVGADPALASGAFVTTVTDVVGFLSFLGLAALLLI